MVGLHSVVELGFVIGNVGKKAYSSQTLETLVLAKIEI